MKFRLTEEIWKEGNMYVSYCPELDISSCGDNIEQAKKNLYETIQINIEETKKWGLLKNFLMNVAWKLVMIKLIAHVNNLLALHP